MKLIAITAIVVAAATSISSGAQQLFNGATTTSSFAHHTFLDATTAGTKAWVFKNSNTAVAPLATTGDLTSVTPVGVLTSGSPDLTITGASFAGVGFYEWFGDPDKAARDAFSNNTGFYGNSITITVPPAIAGAGTVYHVELLGQFGFSNDRRFNVTANGNPMVTNWTILNSGNSNSVLEFDIVPGASGITLALTTGTDAGVDTMPYVHALAITPMGAPVVTTAPTFDPPGGGYASAQLVTITSDIGSSIHYTTDGSDPLTSGTVATGSSPLSGITIPLNTTRTIRAYATNTGTADSSVANATYSTYPVATWTNATGGDWATGTNWLNQLIASGVGVEADFSTLDLLADAVVTLSAPQTIGRLTFGDTVPSNDWTISGSTITLNATSPTISVNNGTATINSNLIGTNGLTKQGGGTLTLGGNNTYTGTTAVNVGTLSVTGAINGGGGLSVAGGASLDFRAGNMILGGLTGGGTVIHTAGNFFRLFGNNSAFAGTFVQESGIGYVGNTTVSTSELATWTINGGVLALGWDGSAGYTAKFGALSGAGGVIESSYQGNGVFTVEAGALNTDTTTATVIKDRDSVDLLSTQKLALTKVGTGTLTLAGLNTYTGNTTINGGKLVLDYSGQLKFSIGADGVNNTITGSGAVQLDGIFLINLENANLTHGNSWQLVDVDNLTETYGLDFFVQSFDADEDGVTWSLVDGDKTWTFSEDTGVLSLSIVPTVTGFALWATTNAQGQTIAQDHDNDGVSNGIEYFMGLSGSAFTGNPAPDASRRISWPKGATYSGVYGIDYAVQTSSDLGTWTDVPVGQVTDGNILEYTIPAGSSAKFARLKVAGP